ncbi:MAG: hypothetical protein KGI47_05000 [Betaproteobacteria bacterium]|nr:hypothetical protein [Betaproteobacteria bacterium]MDE2623078.1 hypothetical protein [Betaproteobacteria bacterium]
MKQDSEDRPDERPDGEAEAEGEGRARGRKGKEERAGRRKGGNLPAWLGLTFGILGLALGAAALFLVHGWQEKLAAQSALVTDLTHRLTAANDLFAKTQMAIRQTQAIDEEKSKRREQRDALMIHAMAQVQTRLKMAPTIEKMLEPVPAGPLHPAAAAAPAAPAAAPAAVPAPVSKAPAPESPKAKITSQVQGIREAIRKYNGN